MKNERDIGYGNIRKGVLFRGEQLVELSREDKDRLFKKDGIKTVIDLRAPEELEENPDADIPGVKNINLPLLTIGEMSELIQGRFPNVPGCYRRAVSPEKKAFWTKLFEILLENEEGAILFHCSQGKDRTGIVAAAILSALGASHDVILQDYLATNEHASMPDEYRQYAQTLPEDLRKIFMGLFFVDADFLKESFDEINKQFGSMDAFLRENGGLDAEKLAKLKAKYIRPKK